MARRRLAAAPGHDLLIVAAVASWCWESASGLNDGGDLMKGICYGPFPAKQPKYGSQLIDDFMSDVAKPLWGMKGRNDLQTISQLGANTVRLYGNNPNASHAAFLDTAASHRLAVIPGISDYPYTQQQDSCAQTNYDCYEQVKHNYAGDLRNGWLRNGHYHPAIKHIIVINEPDLKLGVMKPKLFCRGILSAIDGILDAEKEAGVNIDDPFLPSFTVTFSFGTCTECMHARMGVKPALSQMLELHAAFQYPNMYGYTPKNDLMKVYSGRFINSFNTQNSATELQDLFFTAYSQEFPNKPVFIGEFHSIHPPRDQSKELSEIMSMAKASTEFIGINFFEFQVRYDKGGSEAEFGMFGLGNYKIMSLGYFGVDYNVWCLDPVPDPITRQKISEELTTAFGGNPLATNYFTLCEPNPNIVALDVDGFQQLQALSSGTKMAAFIFRVVEHMGGQVTDRVGLTDFAGSVTSFADVENIWHMKPSWATWDVNAACVADRNSDSYAVGLTIQKACQMTDFNCDDIPWDCKGDPWKTADYVLSTVFYMVRGNPLEKCNFDGTAIFATSKMYHPWDPRCVVNFDPATTPLTEQGFQAVIHSKKDPSKEMEVFMERVIVDSIGARIVDRSMLQTFAEKPPTSMYDMKRLLVDAQWICGGHAVNRCNLWSGGAAELWWWKYAAFALLGFVGMAVCCSVFCVKCGKQCHEMCPHQCFDSDSDVET